MLNNLFLIRIFFTILITLIFRININVHSLFPTCVTAVNKCPNENVTFWLYNRSTQNSPIKIEEWKLNQYHFYPGKPLKIIIHGYTGHKDFAPNTKLRPAFLQELDVTIISVDYGPLVKEPCYFHAATLNYLVAARCTANLVNLLVSEGYLHLEDIHVIGFSLGGQVAGALASFLTVGKLSRITGLDPAKPFFISANESRKLDKSDAHFVDVIHTDILARGMAFPLGHIDFYPNGGTYQPGCSSQESIGSCNHDRAPAYYAESIRNSNLGFWGYKCDRLQYHSGLCKYSSHTNQELMGYYVNTSARGVYFLETNAEPPYAKGPYPEVLRKN